MACCIHYGNKNAMQVLVADASADVTELVKKVMIETEGCLI